MSLHTKLLILFMRENLLSIIDKAHPNWTWYWVDYYLHLALFDDALQFLYWKSIFPDISLCGLLRKTSRNHSFVDFRKFSGFEFVLPKGRNKYFSIADY